MRVLDLVHLTLGAVAGQRLRSALTALGIAVGVAAVVLLTAIGEGIQRFVLAEFTQFGANLIAVNPGRSTTAGISGAVISNVRPLSLADAEALTELPRIEAIVPLVQGNAEVEAHGRQRRTTVFGVGHAVPKVWRMEVAMGRFLPEDDPRAARAFAVLGQTVYQELFQQRSPLGERIRIGGERYRVIGVMAPKGRLLGFDLDDSVYIPADRAMGLFRRESLMEVDLLYMPGSDARAVADKIRERLTARHGEHDFTVTTQEEMLDVLGSVLAVLTAAVGALGGISLLVGGVGILTIMIIAVNERTSEIGLLRALGARRGQVLLVFMAEALTLGAVGGAAGLVLGVGGAWLLGTLLPQLPTHIAWGYLIVAEGLAAIIGLTAGILPARRAAALDPIAALRAE